MEGLKEIQSVQGNLPHNTLHPINISPVLNKPLREIALDIEKPSKSILSDKENLKRRSFVLTHPFKITAQRIGERLYRAL
jgi:hypothetical protein